MDENAWRRRADSFTLPDLRTERYEELRHYLALRDLGQTRESFQWVEETEQFFLEVLESSELQEENAHRLVDLAELFSAEGVESWLEAFELFRLKAPKHEVLAAAERGQRYLLVVQEMASEF